MKKFIILVLCVLTAMSAAGRKWSHDIITFGIGGGIHCTSARDVTYDNQLYTSQFSSLGVMPDLHIVVCGAVINFSCNFARSPKGPSDNMISPDHARYTVASVGYLFPVLSTRDSDYGRMSTFTLYVSPTVGMKRRAQLFYNNNKTAMTDTYAVFGGAVAVRYKHLYLLGSLTNEGFGAALGVAF